MCQTYGNFLKKRSSQISIKNQLELSKEDIERDEIVYERDNLRYYGADAFIQSTYDLGGFYKVIIALKIFPKIFRDIIFKFISKNRHRIFQEFHLNMKSCEILPATCSKVLLGLGFPDIEGGD